ncbi:HpcH/HpaI aldolase family protein [Desulfohalovibrio reitneri]|uniref:HpcH/HpaI aldolase family protein n=1 Tax=Desulfohalovibrio reitneri TaxID=1307759 RepID=UPI0006911245|nr:aldolase/citrate lyase family protein [Desulfohalovibrio reitneri]
MNDLKQTLRSGGAALGSWITLAHPAVAEIMARSGFSWLAVDLEHSSITLGEAERLIRTIDLCGASPMVRLSSNDPVQIKRVMDAGAHGLIVPMVNTPDEARAAASAMHYPPRGTRGVGLYRAQAYGVSFPEYKQALAERGVLIVQVEHIEAVRNLEAILAVDDVDGFIVGPYDLSASLGHPGEFEHPDVLAALRRIEEVGMASDKAPGIHIIEPRPEELSSRMEQGYRFVAYSLDIRMLDAASRGGVAAFSETN